MGTMPSVVGTGIRAWFLAERWGGHALISLYISILSGVVLGLQYNPADPFYSTATIELAIPFGYFWRSLHYYASQAFFLLLLTHLAISILQNSARFTRTAWLRLTASVPVSLLLLFTGYVLRGDATGEAAGTIAEHITLSIPVLGDRLNTLLFDVGAAGMRKVYLNHLAGLTVLGSLCMWPHLRRYTARWRNHALLVLVLVLCAALVKTPLDPERFGLLHIPGPWFFLGAQELLRRLPVFWAGVAIPSIPVALLFLLPSQGRTRAWVLTILLLWLASYTVLSGFGLFRG